MSSDKSHRGNASQFFVAAELCRRGLMAVVTMGNSPNTDVLCSDKSGEKFVHIQVKTFRPSDNDCSVGAKAEKVHGDNFFWILCGMPEKDEEGKTEYYIIPSKILAKNVSESHQIWMDTPGKKGQAHNITTFRSVAIPPNKSENGWDISQYLNRWDLIEEKLSDSDNR